MFLDLVLWFRVHSDYLKVDLVLWRKLLSSITLQEVVNSQLWFHFHRSVLNTTISFFSQLLIWYFTTFTAGRIKEKIHLCNNVHYLYRTIHPDELDIPPFVLEHDMKVSHFLFLKSTYSILSFNAFFRKQCLVYLYSAMFVQVTRRKV